MKKLFVLGDSISIYYGPYLEQYIERFFEYDRKGKGLEFGDLNNESQINGGDSSHVLSYLRENPSLDYDVLLLNCGLHDIKTDAGKKQVSESEYEKNLNEIINLIHNRGKKLIWVNTTPVDENRHNSLCNTFFRYDSDVERYNEIAKNLFTKHGVPIIELNAFTQALPLPIFSDHVHFTQEVSRLQAAFIAGNILSIMRESL